MTTPVDLVTHHVGGLLQAALNAYAAGTCDTVVEEQPFHGAPTISFPCLSIWRESEKPTKRAGTGGRIIRTVMLKALYEYGPRKPEQITTATAILADVVGAVNDALEDERCATYPAAGGTYPPGTGLNTLAGVTAIGLTNTKYLGGSDSYPVAEFTIECEYEHSRYVAGTTLVDLLGTVNTSTGLEATPMASGGITLDPLVSGVVVSFVWAAAPAAITVTYRTITITVVGGTTTMDNVKTAVEADAAADALVTVGGTGMTFPALTPGTVYTVGLSLPRAQQISTPV